MSIAGKIFARILLNRLNEHLERSGHLTESQCGFRKNSGTIDMTFTARQLQEKCQEQNVDLYMAFVDLTKAFDTVSHEGLWKLMAKFGCPAKFIAMKWQFHDGMLARVQSDGEFSDPFPVTNGVKQGCVLASTLFSMMFSAMLTDAFQDRDNGILIRYRIDGKLFNLRRLQAKSKMQTEVLDEFLCAVDIAKGAPTEEKMQKGVDQVFDSCDSYDLTISIKKTEVVYQPAPGKPYKETTITVKGQRLQVVDKFTYLGSTLSRVVHIDDEVNVRIAKASAAFGRLHGSIWNRSGMRLDTKLKVYRSVVLLYACEACNEECAFFTSDVYNNHNLWSCQKVCDALVYLLDNIFIRFGTKLYRQTIGIPMGHNCAPLVADLFLFCYERDFMKSLSRENQADIIEAFKSTSKCLDDLLNIDNIYFDQMVDRIYPAELQLNRANFSDTEVPFLDLNLCTSNGTVSTKNYDKRDDFGFDIVSFPFLDGDVPRHTSYGVYIFQLIRFARASSNLTAKLLRQG